MGLNDQVSSARSLGWTPDGGGGWNSGNSNSHNNNSRNNNSGNDSWGSGGNWGSGARAVLVFRLQPDGPDLRGQCGGREESRPRGIQRPAGRLRVESGYWIFLQRRQLRGQLPYVRSRRLRYVALRPESQHFVRPPHFQQLSLPKQSQLGQRHRAEGRTRPPTMPTGATRTGAIRSSSVPPDGLVGAALPSGSFPRAGPSVCSAAALEGAHRRMATRRTSRCVRRYMRSVGRRSRRRCGLVAEVDRLHARIARTDAGDPCARILPWSSTITRSAKPNTTSMSCSVNSTAIPSCFARSGATRIGRRA